MNNTGIGNGTIPGNFTGGNITDIISSSMFLNDTDGGIIGNGSIIVSNDTAVNCTQGVLIEGCIPGAGVLKPGIKLCTIFSCPDLLGDDIIPIGLSILPYLVSLLIMYWVLDKVKFKANRISHYVRYGWLDRKPAILQSVVIFLMYLGIFSPVLCIVFMTTMSMTILSDFYVPSVLYLIGLSIVTFSFDFYLLFYGFMHWRYERWRLDLSTMACFGVAFLLLAFLALIFAIVFSNNELLAGAEKESLYAIFITFNLLFTTGNIYLSDFMYDALMLPDFFSLRPNDRNFMIRVNKRKTTIRSYIVYCTLASWLVLMLFAVALTNSEQSDDYGWQVLWALFMADLHLIFQQLSSITPPDPLQSVALNFFTRVSIFAAGKDLWFIGVSANYFVLSIYSMLHILDRRYPLVDNLEVLDSMLGGLEAELNAKRFFEEAGGMAQAQRAEGDEKIGNLKKFKRVLKKATKLQDTIESIQVFKRPEFSLFLSSILFVIYTVLAFYSAESGWYYRYLPAINWLGVPHEQYEFGAAAMVLVIVCCLFMYSARIAKMYNYGLRKRSVVSQIIFLVFSGTMGLILFIVTDSFLILSLGLVFPVIVSASFWTYAVWRGRDFKWNSWRLTKKRLWEEQRVARLARDNEKKRLERLTQSHRKTQNGGQRYSMGQSFARATIKQAGEGLLGDDIEQNPYGRGCAWFPEMIKDFICMNGEHESTDYLLLLAVLGILALCMLLVIVLNINPDYQDGSGLFIGTGVFVIILTTFFLFKWFNTFTVGLIGPFALSITLALNTSALNTFIDVESYPSITFFPLTAFPCILCFVMAGYRWQSFAWRLDIKTKVLFAIGYLLLFTYLLGIAIINGVWEDALANFVLFLVMVFFTVTAMAWSANRFYLPSLWKKLVLLVVGTLFILFITYCIVAELDWYFGFGSVMLIVEMFLLVQTISKFGEAETSKLLPSRNVFPIYRFDSGGLTDMNLEIDNEGAVYFYCFCIGMIGWGYVLACLLSTSTYIGWLMYNGAILMAITFTIHNIVTPATRFWKAWVVMQNHPQIVEDVRLIAIQAHSEKLGDAFGQESLYTNADIAKMEASDPVEAAKATLRNTRQYWQWEESETVKISSLIAKRERFLRDPRPDETRNIYEVLCDIDEEIRACFEEQSFIVAFFQLSCVVQAKQIQEKNRTVARDFILMYHKQDKLPNLNLMTGAKVRQWVEKHFEELLAAKEEYVLMTHKRLEAAEENQKKLARAQAKRKQRGWKGKMRSKIDEERMQSFVNSEVKVQESGYRKRESIYDIDSIEIVDKDPDVVKQKALEVLDKLLDAHYKNDAKNPQVFYDDSFPVPKNLDALIDEGSNPEKKELNEGKIAENAMWLRSTEFLQNTMLFSDGCEPADIVQGDIEDCYLLAAMSVIALHPELVDRLFISFADAKKNKRMDEIGLYCMMFYVDGLWRAVIVDDQFPTKNSKFVFGHSLEPFEMWVPVLEKCYAKLYNGYQNIIMGLVHESFKDLTGGLTEEIIVDDRNVDILWQKLLTYHQEGYLMGCGNPKSSTGNFEVVAGIVQGHAYSILDVLEASGKRLVALSNPWGTSEWDGDWCQTSPMWTQKMRRVVKPDFSGGQFYMSYNDFAYHFNRVYLCRLFENAVDTKEDIEFADPDQRLWYRQKAKSQWKGSTAQGVPSKANLTKGTQPELNPQWSLTLDGVEHPTYVFISISQPTQVNAKDYKPLSLVCVDKEGMRVRTLKNTEIVAGQLKFQKIREMSVEVFIQPGKIYTIFPCLMEPAMESEFEIVAYCREPMLMTKMNPRDTDFS